MKNTNRSTPKAQFPKLMLAPLFCLGITCAVTVPVHSQQSQGMQTPEVNPGMTKAIPAMTKDSIEKYFTEAIEADKKKKSTDEQIKHLCLLSQFYNNNGDKAKAEQKRKEALALAQKSGAASKSMFAETMLNTARNHLNSGDFDKAQGDYDSAIKGLPADTPKQNIVRAKLEQQALYIYTGRYKEAAALSPQITQMARTLDDKNTTVKASTFDQQGEIEYLQGHYKAAEAHLKEALALLNADKVKHPLDESIIKNDLGGLYSDLENYDLAEKYLNESIDSKKQLLGDSNANPVSASSLSNLAKLQTKKGNLDYAEKQLQAACQARKSGSGIAALAYARSLCDLAEVERLKGKLDEAEKLNKETLAIYKKQFGNTNHPDAATALNNLAMVQADRGKLDEAQTLLKQALDCKQKAFANQHPDCAVVLNNLAYIAEKKQQFAEADKYYAQAQQITSAAFGTQHPAFATELNNRALLAESMGKDADAEKLQLQSIEIRRKYAKVRNADLVSSLNNLGELYMAQGKFDKAAFLLDEAQKNSDKPGFPDKRSRATLLGNLALLNDRKQDYPAAEKWYKLGLTATADSYGKTTLEYARALSNLAGLYRVEKKFKDAEPLQKESLAIRIKVSGADSTDAAREYNNTGELNLAQGQLSDAETMLNKALKIRQAKLGEQNKDTSVTLCALGKLRLAQKNLAESEQLLNKALQIQSKILKNNDEKLANTYFALADLATAKGKKDQSTKMKEEGDNIMRRAKTGA